MKKLTVLFQIVALLFCALAVTSCDNDDDGDNNSLVIVDGDVIDMNYAYFAYDGYSYYFLLSPDPVTGDYLDNLDEGAGDAIFYHLNKDRLGDLVEFDGVDEDEWCYFEMNYDGVYYYGYSDYEYEDISGGTIKVTQTGSDVFNIIIDLEVGGIDVSCNIKGRFIEKGWI